MYSPAFYPGIGGVESVAGLLADGLSGLGCDVRVVTSTPGNGDDDQFRFDVIRSPSPAALLAQVNWCDVFFQQNVSLKGLWPLALFRRRFVVAHHGLYARGDGSRGWQARLKYYVSRFAGNIAVSRFVARELGDGCTVIPNPYREDIFRLLPGVARDLELVFVGRLVSEKGVDLLLAALALLRKGGVAPCLTVVGEGPEEPALRRQAVTLGLSGQVMFVGRKSPADLSVLLNRHKLLVVPSLVREGFGVVALEGIACGCVVVASDHGGLPEAVGPCGLMFPPGDAGALAGRIAMLLGDAELPAALRSKAREHLESHTRQQVAARYLEAIQNMAGIA